MLITLLTWTTLFALYLLFAGQATGAELCASALTASVGTGLHVYLHRSGRYPVRPHAPWLRLISRVGASLARDTLAVGGALARASAGRSVRGLVQPQEFVTGGEGAAGRRGAVILAASVAPNGFVERVVIEDQVLLLHRLVSVPPREDRLWPV